MVAGRNPRRGNLEYQSNASLLRMNDKYFSTLSLSLFTQDKGKKRATGWFPASYVKLLEKGGDGGSATAAPAVATGAEQVRALYAYAATQDDELGFEAGDLITVVNKDKEEWWSGELNGKTGVFPANYVEPVA